MFPFIIEAILQLTVLAFTMVVIVMRWLPTLMRVAIDALQMAVAVSCALYRSLFARLAPIFRAVGIDLLRNPWRSLFAALLSWGISSVICFGMDVDFTWVIAIGAIVHGLIVGFVWDQLGTPTGLSLGR